MRNRLRDSLACLVIVVFCSCSSKPESLSAPSGAPIQAQELMTDYIKFEFAVYYLPVPSEEPLAALDELLGNEFTEFQKVDEISESLAGQFVHPRVLTDVQESYAPPDIEFLQRFGFGISREQAETLQNCTTALVLDFEFSKEDVWEGLRAANELTSKVARATGGVLWDEETRQVFTPDAWNERRLDDWNEGVPNISRHVTIHAYSTGEYARAITLGMAKFGLPDIVIDGFPWSNNRSMGHIINLFSQAIAEGAAITTAGEFDLDIKQIKHPDVREPQLASLKDNATAVARLSLREGRWEEGDPNNRLVEITFDRYSGNDVFAKQEEMASSLFGWEDSIDYVQHNDEIRAASQRARRNLAALKEAINAGLSPGEFIQVKAPFDTPDGGREWMWVEVTSWKGDKIRGLLKNEPFNIPDLHGGQVVEVPETDVFDYIRKFPDGTQEGNETGELMAKEQQ